MASSLNTFPLSHMEAYSKFIPYIGPPVSKPHSRYRSSKSVAHTPIERHVLDNTSTVELTMEQTPENENTFTLVQGNSQLTNLSDGGQACDSKLGGRVDDDKDEFVIDVELQDEVSHNGLILDQYASLTQQEAADRASAQITSTKCSIKKERGNDSSIHEVDTMSSRDTTRLYRNESETMCFMQRDFVEQPCSGTIKESSNQPIAVNNGSRDDNITATDYDKGDCDINMHEDSQCSLVQIDRTTNVDSQRQHAGAPADGGPNESRLLRSMENTLHSNTSDEAGSVADLQQQSKSMPDPLQIFMDGAPFNTGLNSKGKASIRNSVESLTDGSGGQFSISGEDGCSNHFLSQLMQQTNHRAAIEARTRPFNPPFAGQTEEEGKHP
ncbi:hypothetical protein EKO04_011579 [Ascochyta lentis]|uniref:Uncharacterized protein n=1 Tax=Ascochyta lentis TaxID=205686 RepID=A0A8H7IT58_9PLEO|nr:hypothetical protein EKO04_011579 [Ascochyta lentis]